MTTDGQAPFPAPWINGRFGTCCLDFCGHPNMELRPCANRSQTGCNKGCHRVCAQAAGLEPNGGHSGKFFCSKDCMDGTNTNPNSNNTTNTDNNPNSTTTFGTMEEAFDPSNNPIVALAMQQQEELEANMTPPPTPPPKPPSDSPAEEIRDEDMNLQERRMRFSEPGATHFQRGVNRRHDEGHLGGAHGRQAGVAYYDALLPEEGEVDMKAGGVKCSQCGGDCERRKYICPECKWSMHATCGIEGILDPRYRWCDGCLGKMSKQEAKRIGNRDEASKQKLIYVGALPRPKTTKRKPRKIGGGSGGSKRSSGGSNRSSGSSKRRRTGAGGSGGSRGNNNNNNNNNNSTAGTSRNNDDSAGTIRNNDNGNATTAGADNTNNNSTATNDDEPATAVDDGNNDNDGDATTNDNTGRRIMLNPITTAQMREGVVDPKVFSRYVNEIIHFLQWLGKEHPDWLTNYCKEKQNEALVEVAGEGKMARRNRIKQVYMDLVKDARNNNIIFLEKFKADGIMEYLALQANQYTGKKLSPEGYSGKRTAIKHMVRCQYGKYWSSDFENELTYLWRGFIRMNNPKMDKPKKKRRRRNEDNNEEQDQQGEPHEPEYDSDSDSEDDRDEFKQGKSCMTTQLYRMILKWFLEWNSFEGIFCAVYICMTWNLACRANNTAKVKFSHMSWTFFDAMHINFAHTKTEQHGQAKRHKRAIYSNPLNWEMNMPMLLGLWLSVGFNTAQRVGDRLFPGGAEAQKARVGELLKKLLKEHEEEVLQMGYDNIDEIGLHSIRKGVSTYLASLPGGPPPAALCLRAGWSMGRVKDIYFHQTRGGDEFVGRCAAMLNLMNGEFATSPPYFKSTIDNAVKKEAMSQVFPHFKNCAGMDRILEQCLASMVYHRDKVLSLATGHAARKISLYRQEELLSKLADHVVVSNAWDATGVDFTGIPPHIKSLVDIAGIKQQQSKLVEEVYNKVMKGVEQYFDEKEIGGGQLSESRIRNMMSQALTEPMKALGEQISKMSTTTTTSTNNNNTGSNAITITETGTNPQQPTFYKQYLRDGVYSRLPKDFEFPRGGLYDLWYQWNVGDSVEPMPPLRDLKADDYKFLDKKPKTVEEKRFSKGKYSTNRRRASTTYSDIKWICKYIEEKAEQKGMDLTNRKPNNVIRIYEEVSPMIYEGYAGYKKGERNTQFKWQTIIKKLRKRVKEEREKEAAEKLARNAAARAASRAAAAAAAAALQDNNDDDSDSGYDTEKSKERRRNVGNNA